MNPSPKQVSPIAWVPTLYFAMGMPFVVLNMVCTLMYKGMGVSDAQIAFWTSLIMLPWTLTPLWSPFLEMYRTKKFGLVSCREENQILAELERDVEHKKKRKHKRRVKHHERSAKRING